MGFAGNVTLMLADVTLFPAGTKSETLEKLANTPVMSKLGKSVYG
jgi:hypothetical protein